MSDLTLGDFEQEADGRWRCLRCAFEFGRRSAHVPGGDRCKAFSAGLAMRADGWSPIQGNIAIWLSQGYPELIKHAKAILGQNEPVRSYAWSPDWVLRIYDAYQGHKSVMMYAAFSGDGNQTEDERRIDKEIMMRAVELAKDSPDIQQAVLAVHALDDTFPDEGRDAVWEFLKGVVAECQR